MIAASPEVLACSRCSRLDRVVADDGFPVCIRCILAWGSYARLAAEVAGSEVERRARVAGRGRDARVRDAQESRGGIGSAPGDRDPTVTALLHWSHRTPVSGCPLCADR